MAKSLSPASAAPPTSKQLRARYKEAMRAFIGADWTAALAKIQAALPLLPEPAASPSWVDLLDAGPDTAQVHALDLRRKIVILFVTLIATCLASQKELAEEAKQHELLGPYLALKPEAASGRLFTTALSKFDAGAAVSDDLPLPSPGISRLPPSVAVSLALGALKMQAPRAAKAIVEAWLGSIDERAENALEAEGEHFDASPESSMSSSALSLSTPSDTSGSPKRDALLSYERLLEVHALHILPALSAWDEASEWVKLLAKENGGYARSGKVEWLSSALEDTKSAHTQAVEDQHQRAVAQAEHEKELKKQKARKAKKRAANGHASDGQSSASQSPPKPQPPPLLAASPPPPDPEPALHRPEPSVTGFAAMRSALSDYLRPRPPSSVARPRENLPDRFARLLLDQGRLLSVIAFIFSFLLWRRRAKRTMRETAGDFWVKVKETVGMATTASYL